MDLSSDLNPVMLGAVYGLLAEYAEGLPATVSQSGTIEARFAVPSAAVAGLNDRLSAATHGRVRLQHGATD